MTKLAKVSLVVSMQLRINQHQRQPSMVKLSKSTLVMVVLSYEACL